MIIYQNRKYKKMTIKIYKGGFQNVGRYYLIYIIGGW